MTREVTEAPNRPYQYVGCRFSAPYAPASGVLLYLHRLYQHPGHYHHGPQCLVGLEPLAGLRIGYLVGPVGLVVPVAKMVVPFSVSSLAQAAAIACLEAGDELRTRTDAVVAERSRVRDSLLDMGHAVPDTQANFVWLPLGDASADFDAHCREHLVVTRCFAGDGVRVSIGDPAENDRFLAAAQEFVTVM